MLGSVIMFPYSQASIKLSGVFRSLACQASRRFSTMQSQLHAANAAFRVSSPACCQIEEDKPSRQLETTTSLAATIGRKSVSQLPLLFRQVYRVHTEMEAISRGASGAGSSSRDTDAEDTQRLRSIRRSSCRSFNPSVHRLFSPPSSFLSSPKSCPLSSGFQASHGGGGSSSDA